MNNDKAKRYNKIPLNEVQNAVRYNKKIEISNIENDEIKGKELIIIKRDGREENFDPKKLRKIIMWATDNSKELTDELLRDTEIKLHNKIKVTDMYKALIVTAVNKISMLYSHWEYIAAKLKLMEYYKEIWNIKNVDYPHIKDILQKGIMYKIYNAKTINSYTEEEIEIINSYIDRTRDQIFNYKGLVTFFDKYCLNYSKTKTLELPQFTYMRVAMAMMVNEKPELRLNYIKELYDALSLHHFTAATPILLNAMTKNQQLSSCVLTKMADDTTSILDTNKNLGIYSKFKGGTALDISEIRSKGSYIQGNQGYSSGPVPFLKLIESTMKALNQGSVRNGSCCVYFQWWHLDVEDLLVLKSNGGIEDNRARNLKYSMKINNIFIDRVMKNQNISLFDPKDTKDLIGLYGKEFEDKYIEYESKSNIKKKTIPARTLLYKLMKERTETGNIYLFHEENVNEQSLLNRYINSSNLCTEIMQPSRYSVLLKEQIITKENNEKSIIKEYSAGEIALCNLSSYNLEKWFEMTVEERQKLCNIVVRFLDNTIDLATYPVKEGKNSNKMYRYMGIGVLNYTNYLALNKITIDTNEALEETDRLFDDLSYNTIQASVNLSKEKGRFEKFYETKWADGYTPYMIRNKNVDKLTTYEPDHDRWYKLRKEIQKYGVRNATMMAIAPTATSGKAINATESIEPIQDFFYKEKGTITIPTIVTNFKKNSQYYKKAFDCDQYKLLELAAIRQKWIDQSQSVNVYITNPNSLLELTKLHFYGFYLGMKSFYYLKQIKQNGLEEVECESCS